MKRKITLSWKEDYPVDYFNVYRSREPFTKEVLPMPVKTTKKYYKDVVDDTGRYYYMVGAVLGGQQAFSDVLSVFVMPDLPTSSFDELRPLEPS